MTLDDPAVGAVEVEGRYRPHQRGDKRGDKSSDTLVILVHGLGGHADSAYMVDAALAVEAAGHSCLRLCLRGAAGSGEDFYHAGLTDDLLAALDHPDFAHYDNLVAVGFSLGGHVALRTAVEGANDRLRAVAAICPPLDLAAGQAWLDAPARKIYREYILRELRAMYAEVALRGRAPTPMQRIEQVRTLREWDALTVVPRFGFDDVDDYYGSMSVGPRLADLSVPTLLVVSRHDPMIPAGSIEPMVAPALASSELAELQMCWADNGGHVFFPPAVDLGLGRPQAVVPQALDWLDERCRG